MKKNLEIHQFVVGVTFLGLFMSLSGGMLSPLPAQEPAISVQAITESFFNINYNRTIELSTEALKDYQRYSQAELIEIYKYRAFAYFSTGDENNAYSAFRTIITLDHNTNLDSVTVSPKIIAFFSKIKNEVRQNSQNTPDSKADVRYVLIETPGPGAAWRSALLPGWGQFYKNDETKGYILSGFFLANTAALIYSLIQEIDLRDAYRNETNSARIDSKYNKYNDWYHARQILSYSEILIYLYTFADALWMPAPTSQGFSLHLKDNSVFLSLSF